VRAEIKELYHPNRFFSATRFSFLVFPYFFVFGVVR